MKQFRSECTHYPVLSRQFWLRCAHSEVRLSWKPSGRGSGRSMKTWKTVGRQVPVRASFITYFGVSDPAGRTRLMTDQKGSGDRKCNAGPAEHEAPAGMAGSNIASGGSSKGRIGSYPHHRDHLCKGLPLLIPVYGYHATLYKLYWLVLLFLSYRRFWGVIRN